MSAFNERNWLNALVDVYKKSLTDSTYRNLCLSDPVAAVNEVSDVELPADFKFQFFDGRKDYLYTFLLPPVSAGNAPDVTTEQLIQWATICTNPPTIS